MAKWKQWQDGRSAAHIKPWPAGASGALFFAGQPSSLPSPTDAPLRQSTIGPVCCQPLTHGLVARGLDPQGGLAPALAKDRRPGTKEIPPAHLSSLIPKTL